MDHLALFATVPPGLESMLAGELRGLGAKHLRQARAGVSFSGSLETAYRACLWSRLAGRVLLPVTTGPGADGDRLYETVSGVDWSEHLGAESTIAVDFSGMSEGIRDTRFGGVRVKDAIVDQIREATGKRPSVDARAPDVRVNAHLARGRVTISIDLSGDSLHRRGYRTDRVQVEAPLKENLAAAILLFAAWPHEAASGGSLLDPLCGSGTLPIEAALIAADTAPGLLRAENGRFGFARWRGHDDGVWRELLEEARERREIGLNLLIAAAPIVVVRGTDHDDTAVRIARSCVERAGLRDVVSIERADLDEAAKPAARGLLATNAPYGERLSTEGDGEAVYRLLGRRLREAFTGWSAAVLAGDRRQATAVGLPIRRDTQLRNGPLTCTLAYFEVGERGVVERPWNPQGASSSQESRTPEASSAPGSRSKKTAADANAMSPPASKATAAGAPTRRAGALGGGAEYLANRLRKNRRRLARRLQREGITCYRLYDADLPEYNLVVDIYDGWVHVQEYAAPPEIDPAKTARRLDEALEVIGAVLDVPPDRVVLKQRRRQRGAAQYERNPGEPRHVKVTEDEITYLVDLGTYLDTGFFIDQRQTRRLIRRLAGGRRFLNLFAYTGAMTVNALAGGSPSSTSVDLSATYLDWARRNLAANGFDAAVEDDAHHAAPHTLVRADCLRWLSATDGQYDLIWLDPPTFSNSKRMGHATFDVRRDHADLIRLTARRLLAPGGILLFSTNCRNFRLDHGELSGLSVKDLSRATLAFDCERGASRHHVFRLEHRSRD